MRTSYHVCKHWDQDKRASWFCAFEPKKRGLQFVATAKRSPEGKVYNWWVWMNGVLIGELELLTNGKWRPGPSDTHIKNRLKIEFDTLTEGAAWLDKHSLWAKHNRQHAAHARTQDKREKQVERAQHRARKQVERLARRLKVRIPPLTAD